MTEQAHAHASHRRGVRPFSFGGAPQARRSWAMLLSVALVSLVSFVTCEASVAAPHDGATTPGLTIDGGTWGISPVGDTGPGNPSGTLRTRVWVDGELVGGDENDGSGIFTGASEQGSVEPGEEVEAIAETEVDGEVVDEETEVEVAGDPTPDPNPDPDADTSGRPEFRNAEVQYELAYNAFTTYQVEVEQDPARPLTLHMDYGDGSSETVSVPQGSSTMVVTLSHNFYHPETPGGPHFGTYTQTATVLETGFRDTSTTIHDC